MQVVADPSASPTPPGMDPAVWQAFLRRQAQAIHDVEAGLRSSGAALIGAEMGTGKTVVTATVLARLGLDRVLVVAPVNTLDQWQDALAHWAGISASIMETSSAGTQAWDRFRNGDAGVFLVGQEWLRTRTGVAMKKVPPLELVVWDEAHRGSARGTLTIKTVRGLRAQMRLALSGTWFGNKFENAHSLTRWLWPDHCQPDGRLTVEPSIVIWRAKWCRTDYVYVPGGRRVEKVVGEWRPGEFVKTLPCYVFLESPIGPPPPQEIVRVELGPKQRKQYDDLESQALTWLETETGNTAPLVSDMPLTTRIRLRTAALGEISFRTDAQGREKVTFPKGTQSATLRALHGVLTRPSWQGKQAVILTHSREFAERVADTMESAGLSVALKTGAVSKKKWRGIKERFMAGEVQYLVAVISAVGTGTDGLQKTCHRDVWLSEDDNQVNNMQGRFRVWRLGGNLAEYESVRIIAHDTIDEGVLHKNIATGKMIRSSSAASS